MTVAEAVDQIDRRDFADRISALLYKDYSRVLSARICCLDHDVTCETSEVTLRLHFPAFRGATPTVGDLVDVIALYMMNFTLPRSQIAALADLYKSVPFEEFSLRHSKLEQSALSLFKLAQEATNRNGEAGELILYLLTEWVLNAPQLLAKMSLKTNRNVPVHGADGIHVRYCKDSDSLYLYWGESKLYSDVGQAISEAARSIVKALEHQSIRHELRLVEQNIDLSGLSQLAKASILSYLDPFDKQSNKRVDVTTCLIGFDFDAFTKLTLAKSNPEAEFKRLAAVKLAELAPILSETVKANNLANHKIELFFFPVPSVQELRDLFQAKIGWKGASKPP